jgi:hypothetical protein
MQKRHRIQFPKTESSHLNQDEAYFYLQGSGSKRKIKFHDYDEIYQVPGLYEQIFYDRLKCNSPGKVTSILEAAVKQSHRGVSRLIGIDIIPEAYDATIRDRPGVYDAYYVEDFTQLDMDKKEEIESWQCDCMVTVAALGFGDIPVKAFIEAFNIIKSEGWVAFNIKETFFDTRDESGFSKMIRELLFSNYLDVYYIERYRHRLSIEGEPLYYFAIAGRKNSDVPDSFLQAKGLLA